MSRMPDPFELLRCLGSPEEVLGARKHAPVEPQPQVNAHIHLPPNFSAFRSIEQAVAAAAAQGVNVLGISNYYDYRVYADFAAQARQHRVFPLFGTEIIALDKDSQRTGAKINDPGNPGRIYVCGKAISLFSSPNARAQELLQRIRRADEQRMTQMCERLSTTISERGLALSLTADEVIVEIAERHRCDPSQVVLQERHLAQAVQERLFRLTPSDKRADALARIMGAPSGADPDDPIAVQNAVRAQLMKAGQPCFVPEEFVELAEARELIWSLGGIDCYPTLADGVQPQSPFEAPVEALIANLRSLGFPMAELIPTRNAPEVVREYVPKLRQAGVVVVAGTEHNTPQLTPLEPTCRGSVPVPGRIKEIFWEGTCVIAAHQYLVALGKHGFVNLDGQLHPEYTTDEERITAFARLGAAVIHAFFAKVRS